MEPIYIRTDKNGTKIFHDWTCPRCGGQGRADKWRFTGMTCFECGGTGKRRSAKVVKEYTPEYWAKLQARRAERDAKKQPAIEEEMARQARLWEIEQYRNMGCDENGTGYVLTGDTYPVKDQINKAGGKWVYGRWICPVEFQAEGVKAIRVQAKTKNGRIDVWDALEELHEKQMLA